VFKNRERFVLYPNFNYKLNIKYLYYKRRITTIIHIFFNFFYLVIYLMNELISVFSYVIFLVRV